MNPSNVLQAVIDYRPRHGQSLVPWLTGPTGCGKTMLARQYAERAGLRMHTLLLGTMLPEDVLGLPRLDGVATVGESNVGTTEYTMPQWAVDCIGRPCLLHLDEIDKARPEVVATVLTLLSERSIRGYALHENTHIILSGQPVDEQQWQRDESCKALIGRSVSIPMGYDYEAIERLSGYDCSWVPRPPITTPVVLPTPSARQILYLLQVLRDIPDFARDIAAGVLPPACIPEYVAAKEAIANIDTESYWLMPLESTTRYAASISPAHALELLASAEAAENPERAAILIRMLGKCGDLDLIERARETIQWTPDLIRSLGNPDTFSRAKYGVIIDGVLVL